MSELGPLRFDPIFQYRLWGGRRLGDWMNATLPDGPIGEAWILSDRDDHASPVAEGPLKGRTLTDLMKERKVEILGRFADRFDRFPLLLKFLDVKEMLSVQVHPSAAHPELIPSGEEAKTEAWVVLEADAGCRIYAGLKPHTTAEELCKLHQDTVDDHLASFKPQVGQGVVIEAGTVHALGDGVMVFEVQQNSDITFRLYDWDHVDPTTGKPRALDVEKAVTCVDFDQGAIHPAAHAEHLESRWFTLIRSEVAKAFAMDLCDEPRVLVCIDGAGLVVHDGGNVSFRRGDVILLPASARPYKVEPNNEATLLEISIPANASL